MILKNIFIISIIIIIIIITTVILIFNIALNVITHQYYPCCFFLDIRQFLGFGTISDWLTTCLDFMQEFWIPLAKWSPVLTRRRVKEGHCMYSWILLKDLIQAMEAMKLFPYTFEENGHKDKNNIEFITNYLHLITFTQ